MLDIQTKMSKLESVVNKIKVKMNEKNSHQSRIELLPYCPTEAKKKKNICQKNAGQSKNVVPKSVKIIDGDMWKITWMAEYNEIRQKLDMQSKSIIEKSEEIESLKESKQNQEKLVFEFAKRLQNKNIIIQQLAQQCLANEKTCTETATKTASETYQTREEAEIESPAFEPIKPNATQSSSDSSNCDTNIEMGNSKKTVNAKRTSILYLCPHCSYYTSKKSSMDDHVAEFCENSPVKNKQCKICFKMFTRRGLRIHFNNFTTGKHFPRGEHADFTPEDHEFFKVAAMNSFEYP